MFFLFLKAILIGLSIAIPIGPIATLLIKNSLERGFKSGVAVGLGAALVEGFYSFVAAGSFAFIATFLNDYSNVMKLVCASLLIMLGIYEIKKATQISDSEIKMKNHGFTKTVVLVMFLNITNPMTIVFFAGVFAAIGAINFDAVSIAIISFGAFFGSFSWSVFLSFAVAKMRHKISQKWIKILKIISGIMIAGFGIYGIGSLYL